MTILSQFEQTISEHQLVKAGDTVLIGLSGGPDSVCLLLLFLKIQARLGLKLIAVHINHQLRKTAVTDERFVQKLCAARHVPCECVSISLADATGDSLEQAARHKRLAVFQRLAKKYHADSVALGHHRDDLAETILMRLIRGAGLQGLSAMIPKRTMQGMPVIRPLLNISRAEIESFLKTSGQKFRTDPTNADQKFLRNQIRHALLPLLEKNYNPAIKETLATIGFAIGDDYDFIGQQAQEIFKKLNRASRSIPVTLPAAKLARLHPSLRRQVLRLAIEGTKGNTRQISFPHILAIDALVAEKTPAQNRLQIPGLTVQKKDGHLFFRC